MSRSILLSLIGVSAFLAAGGVVRSAQDAAAGLAFFENQVRPILAEHCYRCHSASAEKVGGGLKLDTKEDFLKGGTDGVVVVAGDAEHSALIKAVRYDDPVRQMPPEKKGGKKLPAEAIATLTEWVAMGAPYPETPPDKRVVKKLPWSMAPVTDPPIPPVRDAAWPATSIDAFLLSKMEERGMKPSPAADKLTLLRRVTFDLTGLPPSPAETDAFLVDDSPGAFAAVVERLLASPPYGEQWGRHWLDVARYADTAGDTADFPLPDAWRYRNYVIDSFRADKPYDRFIQEQIAGDIMARQSDPVKYAEEVTATGFLALSRRFGFDSENYQHLTIQDTIDTMGQSVLGLTLGCARCHDHKFDPVSAKDYYALYGIFESTKFSFPGSEQKKKTRSVVPLIPPVAADGEWRRLEAAYAAEGLTPSAVLRSLDEPDGDFEIQHFAEGGSNGVLVPPWFYDGKVSVLASAQSPFKHLYPFGGVGAGVAENTGDYSIRQRFEPPGGAGVLYVNLDFRVRTADPAAASGKHRFSLGAFGAPPAVEVLLGAKEITLPAGENGAAALTIPLPEPGGWHCLQLALDPVTRTFRGSVGSPGIIVDIPERAQAADSPAAAVDFVSLDSRAPGSAGSLPGLDIDNFGARNAPLPPVSLTPPMDPGLTRPSLASLKTELLNLTAGDGTFEFQTLGTAPADAWHIGPNSGVLITAAAQSPFQNLALPGGQGARVPATPAGGYNGFGWNLPKVWTPDTDPVVHVAFDLRPGEADGMEPGTWRFEMGRSYISPAMALEFNATQLLARSGDARGMVAPLQPGAWHQIQLTLDMKARTYTGSVATRDRRTDFSGNFPTGWQGSVDYMFIDSGGQVAGAKPALDTDNFMITASPLAALDAPVMSLAGNVSAVDKTKVEALRVRIADRAASTEKARQELDARLATGPVPMAYGVTEGTPHDALLQIRGEPEKPGAKVPRGFLTVLGNAELPATATGSGRLELARWLTRADNPLTARVMVNRIWQQHFGRGLVKTPNDFGSRSEPPSHPELLDHLAAEFMRSGWSVKHMHRLILLSSAWRQAAVDGPDKAAREELFAGHTRRRLSAEEIRDAILSVSGELDPVPGQGHRFPPATTWGFSQHGPFVAVYDDNKRSVYLMRQRIKRHPYLALFDGADPNASTAERRVTTVPTQALYFLNDPFVHEKSLAAARRLLAEAGPDENAQIGLAHRLALGRPPADTERAEAAAFLADYRAGLTATGTSAADVPLTAMAAYVRTLFGGNEFLHPD